MRYFILFYFIFIRNLLTAQNLIPNGDFEQYYSCDLGPHSIDSCYYWHSPTTNIQGVSGTPDYYNQCSIDGNLSVPENWFGFQYANSGQAYSGIYLGIGSNYREYIETNLSQTLIGGSCYHFEMYINLANNCRLSTDDIQVYFSNSDITGINNWLPLPFIPQVLNQTGNYFDTLNWTLVSGDYIAQGGETSLIIGNFKDDSLTDTIIVNGSGFGGIIYCYIDDVSLSLCTGINENVNALEEINIFPNPVKEKFKLKAGNVIDKVIVRNTAGKNIYSLTGNKKEELEMDIKNLQSGIYFLQVDIKGKIVFKKLVKM